MLLDHIKKSHRDAIDPPAVWVEEFTVPRHEPMSQDPPRTHCPAMDDPSMAVLSALSGLASLSKLFPVSSASLVQQALLPTTSVANFNLSSDPIVGYESKMNTGPLDAVKPYQAADVESFETDDTMTDQGGSNLDEEQMDFQVTPDLADRDSKPIDWKDENNVDEFVQLYFNEQAFLAACTKNSKNGFVTKILQNTDLAMVMEKLRHFSSYRVPILGRANQRRVAGCPECLKQFNHGFTDLKKHLLTTHLGIRRDLTRFAINFTHSSRNNHIDGNATSPASSSSTRPSLNLRTTSAHSSSRKETPLPSLNRHPSVAKRSEAQAPVAPLATVSSNGLPTLVTPPSTTYTGAAPVHRVIPGTGVSDHNEDMRSLDEVMADAPNGRGGIISLDDEGSPVADAVAAANQPQQNSSATELFLPELGRQHIQLAYSMPVFKRLLEAYQIPMSERIQLINRMNHYARMHVVMDVLTPNGAQKRFACPTCMYTSVHSLADIRKHIMGSHCGISTKRFRVCLRASRHDTTTYRLHSDDRMIRFVEDHKRRHIHVGGSKKEGKTNSSDSPDDGECPMISKRLCIRQPAASDRSAQSNDGRSTLATSVTSQEELETEAIESELLGASDEDCLYAKSSAEQECDQRFLSGFDHEPSPVASHHQNPATIVKNIIAEQSKDSSSPPGEEVHRPIDLPYSVNVLKALLEREGMADQTDDIVERMNIYSNYNLTVVSRGNKICAYICVCGRRFAVIREEIESDIRPASLADCRRHILGVHARIPQELLTLCCQASRISKESGYKLYADHSLIALADQHKFRNTRIQSYRRKCDSGTTPNHKEPNDSVDKSSCDVSSQSAPYTPVSHPNGGATSQAVPRHSTPSASSSRVLPPMVRAPTVKQAGDATPAVVSNFKSTRSLPHARAAGHSNSGKGLDLDPPSRSLSTAEAGVWSEKLGLSSNWSLERIVRLQFSTNVFNKLVRQILDESDPLFTTLLGRMVNYSRYSIYIVRLLASSNSQRIYVCCACSATSQHGFGDVRKHIIGVHVRIPEKFKLAAMNASRLNRDDYMLYPDAQLMLMCGPNRAKLGSFPSLTYSSDRSASPRVLRRRQRSSEELSTGSNSSQHSTAHVKKGHRSGVSDDHSYLPDSSQQSNGHHKPPPVASRPPIILTLPRSKVFHPPPMLDDESDPSHMDVHAKAEDLTVLESATSTSRSRRSMVLKSKRPCPTTG